MTDCFCVASYLSPVCMCVYFRSQGRDRAAAAGQSCTISGEDDHAAELHLCSHCHDGNILIIFLSPSHFLYVK